MYPYGSRTITGGCRRVAGKESGCAAFVVVDTGMGGSTGTGACIAVHGTNSAGELRGDCMTGSEASSACADSRYVGSGKPSSQNVISLDSTTIDLLGSHTL